MEGTKMDKFENLTEYLGNLSVASDDQVKKETTIIATIAFLTGLLLGILLGVQSKGIKLSVFSNNNFDVTNKNNGNGNFERNKKADAEQKPENKCCK